MPFMPTQLESAVLPEHTVFAGNVIVTGGIAFAFAPPTSMYFAAHRPGKSVYPTTEFVVATMISEHVWFDAPVAQPSCGPFPPVTHPVHPVLGVFGQFAAVPTSTAS